MLSQNETFLSLQKKNVKRVDSSLKEECTTRQKGQPLTAAGNATAIEAISLLGEICVLDPSIALPVVRATTGDLRRRRTRSHPTYHSVKNKWSQQRTWNTNARLLTKRPRMGETGPVLRTTNQVTDVVSHFANQGPRKPTTVRRRDVTSWKPNLRCSETKWEGVNHLPYKFPSLQSRRQGVVVWNYSLPSSDTQERKSSSKNSSDKRKKLISVADLPKSIGCKRIVVRRDLEFLEANGNPKEIRSRGSLLHEKNEKAFEVRTAISSHENGFSQNESKQSETDSLPVPWLTSSARAPQKGEFQSLEPQERFLSQKNEPLLSVNLTSVVHTASKADVESEIERKSEGEIWNSLLVGKTDSKCGHENCETDGARISNTRAGLQGASAFKPELLTRVAFPGRKQQGDATEGNQVPRRNNLEAGDFTRASNSCFYEHVKPPVSSVSRRLADAQEVANALQADAQEAVEKSEVERTDVVKQKSTGSLCFDQAVLPKPPLTAKPGGTKFNPRRRLHRTFDDNRQNSRGPCHSRKPITEFPAESKNDEDCAETRNASTRAVRSDPGIPKEQEMKESKRNGVAESNLCSDESIHCDNIERICRRLRKLVNGRAGKLPSPVNGETGSELVFAQCSASNPKILVKTNTEPNCQKLVVKKVRRQGTCDGNLRPEDQRFLRVVRKRF